MKPVIADRPLWVDFGQSTGNNRPEAVTGMRLENELIQWVSKLTVCADTMADIFPAHQIASSRR